LSKHALDQQLPRYGIHGARQRVVNKWKGVRIMKIESLREVKAKLSKIVKDCQRKNPS
jgi:hypothetical protein